MYFLLDNLHENYETPSNGIQLAYFINNQDREQNKKEQINEG